ncbi:hypothetical protein HHK36_028915 [Tetracentron sinense]|uniref:Uncharacterized protein n=1 Tax=Tetracentron sinense TaxID=13715 RepID=A0A835D120_TETSI|nr:hypothetical protein HHK36_028915 [Tetracentron sinense]
MAKVHPCTSCSSLSSSYLTSRRETFTIWMKSLVMHGNGCTVFDSNGEIVYRIDNYHSKCSSEVYLMDLRGKVLFTIRRKKLHVFGRWEGYKSNDSRVKKEKPWFQVRKHCKILKGDSPCEVTVGCDKAQASCYTIERLDGKSSCKIVDDAGRLVAEVKQKQASSGVMLGDDVFTLVVEPHIDHSFIMGIVVVYGLINHKM